MTEVVAKSAAKTKGARIADRLRVAARARCVGRERELSFLEHAVVIEGAPVVFVHGIGGIGKSTLLEAFASRLEQREVLVLAFDGHAIQPTPEAMIAALATALGSEPQLDRVVHALDGVAGELAIVIDAYDGLQLLDAWLRRTLVPALPARAHVVLAGRARPAAAWTQTPGWDALVRVLALGPLDDAGARQLLDRHALDGEMASRVLALADGQPLALELAARAVKSQPDLPLAEVERRHVVAELVRRYLADLGGPEERATVEAASVLRRVSGPVLGAMLGQELAERAMPQLLSLPFVEEAADGLVLHQSVRTAVVSALRTVDGARHRALRTRAWHELAAELVRTPVAARRWQLIADLIYLLDEPYVRDAFFPTDTPRIAMEPAVATDKEAIVTMAQRHLGPTEAAAVEHWWRLAPAAFQVARDDQHRIEGFYLALFATDVPAALRELDPLLARWHEHAEAHFLRTERPVIFARAMVSQRDGAAPGEVRAACFLDLQRWYIQRLDLRAVYSAHYHGREHSLCDRFGFDHIAALDHPGGPTGEVITQVLDFGPGVLHWLSRLLDAQSDARAVGPMPRGVYLCRLGRELLIEGERRPLTRLEYKLLDHLESRAGTVCSREQLLEAVWAQAYTGSNVVDAVVRTLRKKLGAHATAIETVTGHGYRLRADAKDTLPRASP